MKHNEYFSTFSDCVITGASSGIGAAMVSLLKEANPSMRFINLSRGEAAVLDTGGRDVHIPCDLSDSKSRKQAWREMDSILEPSSGAGKLLLINNSGYGLYGDFPAPEVAELQKMIEVNIQAAVELTGNLFPRLKSRGGGIINLASNAAFQPTPHMAVYAASKSFILNWSAALNHELRQSSVRVHTLCPGPTRTGFFRRADMNEKEFERTMQNPETVALAALEGIARGKPILVTGLFNAFFARLTGFLGPMLSGRLAGDHMKDKKGSYQDHELPYSR
jgi:hypothetical protein